MINSVAVPGLEARGYLKRYTDEAVDLCDVLASYDGRAKISLDSLSRGWAYPANPTTFKASRSRAT